MIVEQKNTIEEPQINSLIFNNIFILIKITKYITIIFPFKQNEIEL